MTRELIINATPEETRVALLEDGILEELFIERTQDKGIVGNVYKGTVLRVLPGMQAAFVDIGLERAAFLYVGDIHVPKERVDESFFEDDSPGRSWGRQHHYSRQINALLREGQEILVQVAKAPVGTKGARLTTYISLPGRHLVLMPTLSHVGVSRRIEKDSERRRLKDLIERLRPYKDMSFVARTASENQGPRNIKRDMDYLIRQWTDAQKKYDQLPSPALVYEEPGLVAKTIRDLFTEEVSQIVVDSPDEYEQILKFTRLFLPRKRRSIKLYKDKAPIFDAYGIEMEINRALGRKVWLKSGGYIVIDQSEALVAIDVNTGKFVGRKNLEDTILRTNLEAAFEIAHQIRLRNFGGIIIIDFIDMQRASNREKVFSAFREYLRLDRAKSSILNISEFGLVEMTRQRMQESLMRTLCEACFYCEGRGYIKNKVTVSYEILREMKRVATETEGDTINVYAHPDVIDWLLEHNRNALARFEKRIGKNIALKGEAHFHLEHVEVFGKKASSSVSPSPSITP